MMPDVQAPASPQSARPSFGCVVLTMGDRPEALEAAVASVRDQAGVAADVVVVGNGWRPEGLAPGVKAAFLEGNPGIPAGRNRGVEEVDGQLLFFLDDDARIARANTLADVARLFAEDPRLGLVQLRVDPLGGGRRLPEWVPRWGDADPGRSADVTAVWEGAVAIRRDLFERVGGWPAEFRFVHEGVDLAWRVMAAGYRVHYTGAPGVLHPPPPDGQVRARHPGWLYHGARNRVWLARRYLPLPLGTVYVLSFAARAIPRLRSRERVREWARGYRDGLREPCGPRRPLPAATLWRMTRLGRPPIV